MQENMKTDSHWEAESMAAWLRSEIQKEDDLVARRDAETSAFEGLADFGRWFGNSKVVDANGAPLVCYHGTDAEEDFVAFSITNDVGYHFGSIQTANARLEQIGARAHARVMPVYLSIQNPLALPDLLTWGMESIVPALQAHGLLSEEEAREILDEGYFDEGDFAAILARHGYDGVVYENQTEAGGPSYIALRADQIRSAIGHERRLSAGADDILVGAPKEEGPPEGDKKQTREENLQAWFGKSRIIDAEGRPLRMYHGTTHDAIEIFKRQGHKDSFLGVGPYFTSSTDDACANYAGLGPDLSMRIGGERDRILNWIRDDDEIDMEEVLKEYFAAQGLRELHEEVLEGGLESSRLDELIFDHEDQLALYLARKRNMGQSKGLVMPVYLKVERPFDMTDPRHRLETEIVWSEDGDEIIEERGEIVELVESVNRVAQSWPIGGSLTDFCDWLMQEGADGGLTPGEIFDQARKVLQVYEDEEGEPTSVGQFIQEVLIDTGRYDGMIMDANKYFGGGRPGHTAMEGVHPDTIHVVPFSSVQVKSALGNNGDFDARKTSILESRARAHPSGEKTTDAALIEELASRAKILLGEDAAMVRLADAIFSTHDGVRISGRYRRRGARAVIEVAMNAADPMMALDHEAFHHAMAFLFSPRQADLIKETFRPGGEMAGRVGRLLSQDAARNAMRAPGYLNAEELAAFGFQYYVAGRLEMAGKPKRLFDKLSEFFERTRNWLRGAGFTTAERLFETLDQGGLAISSPAPRRPGNNTRPK